MNDAEPDENPKARLREMTEEEFGPWVVNLTREYARDHVKAGNWSQEGALEMAREAVESLLPEGVYTEDHFLFVITDLGDQRVGVLWLGVNPRVRGAGFIYDLEIDAAYRRKGYATAAMRALEVQARTFNLEKLSLHVFAHNESAAALYRKLGYKATDMTMAKEL